MGTIGEISILPTREPLSEPSDGNSGILSAGIHSCPHLGTGENPANVSRGCGAGSENWLDSTFRSYAGFAILVYALVQLMAPATSNPWLVAFAAGIGWQVLIRIRVNLIQPLNTERGKSEHEQAREMNE